MKTERQWSTDDFTDEFLITGRQGRWCVFVATMRYVFAELPPPVHLSKPPTPEQLDAWAERGAAVRVILDRTPMVRIGGPLDGQKMQCATPGAVADALVRLGAQGYRLRPVWIDWYRNMQTELEQVGARNG